MFWLFLDFERTRLSVSQCVCSVLVNGIIIHVLLESDVLLLMVFPANNKAKIDYSCMVPSVYSVLKVLYSRVSDLLCVNRVSGHSFIVFKILFCSSNLYGVDHKTIGKNQFSFCMVTNPLRLFGQP